MTRLEELLTTAGDAVEAAREELLERTPSGALDGRGEALLAAAFKLGSHSAYLCKELTERLAERRWRPEL